PVPRDARNGHRWLRRVAPDMPAPGCSRRRSRSAGLGWPRSRPRSAATPNTTPPSPRPPAPPPGTTPSASTTGPWSSGRSRPCPFRVRSPAPPDVVDQQSLCETVSIIMVGVWDDVYTFAGLNDTNRKERAAMTDRDPAVTDPLTTAEEQADPRLARSRNRLLDAATHLLSTGGVEAVTVEAGTRVSKVARATLDRHFGSTTQLLAATFERLLPQVDAPTGTGLVREQLLALLTTQADLIEQAPVQMTTLAWVAMGSIGEDHPDPAAVTSLRARV